MLYVFVVVLYLNTHSVFQIALFSSYTLPMDAGLSKHFNEKREWTVGAKLDVSC